MEDKNAPDIDKNDKSLTENVGDFIYHDEKFI